VLRVKTRNSIRGKDHVFSSACRAGNCCRVWHRQSRQHRGSGQSGNHPAGVRQKARRAARPFDRFSTVGRPKGGCACERGSSRPLRVAAEIPWKSPPPFFVAVRMIRSRGCVRVQISSDNEVQPTARRDNAIVIVPETALCSPITGLGIFSRSGRCKSLRHSGPDQRKGA